MPRDPCTILAGMLGQLKSVFRSALKFILGGRNSLGLLSGIYSRDGGDGSLYQHCFLPFPPCGGCLYDF